MELRTDRFKFKDLFPEKARKYAQKLHIKADEIEFVRKGIPIDPKDIEVKEGERAAIRYVTTPHLDRDSEILVPTGVVLDDFRQSPSVLYAHNYQSLPIGKDLWIKSTAKGILAKTQYAKHQFAEDVYQCVKGGFLNSNSVGFIPVDVVNQEDKKAFASWQDTLEKDFGIPKDESKKAKNIYTKWIMLEHSDVPVPSNAQSLNLAVSKGDLPIQSKRLKKDLEVEVVKEDEGDLEVEVVKNFTEEEEIDIEYREREEEEDREVEVEKGEEKRLEERNMETNIVEIDDMVQEVDPEELIEEMALETDKGIEVEAEEEKAVVEIDEIMQEVEDEELGFNSSKLHVDINLADIKEWKELLGNMEEDLREIKEGRVLSRKNRGIVKDAIVALGKVLEADSTGSREDEESESGTVTEREVEIVRDGEKAFSKEDIVKAVKEITGEQMGEILTDVFKKAVDPEKMKAMIGEGIRLELKKLRGKVE